MGIEECFNELKDDEISAAECIHCLLKHGEVVIYDDELKRLKLGREVYDKSYVDQMKRISEILGINSFRSYTEKDKEYNLTMY
ncbi:hypothetical protein [Picrophilus oshimae]|uniref:Uncharacterized protein n=1 Tax=Picrophilus torridus (strain ATCC 700027 / DSM 9790 / JCM 10055 / NBRC 100828 / KAW 2/3) TaxID=1122961 RepID=Q6KZ57_PICTO|nr:hypothetical protein [Picrophilus oshimae]AAT43995.1 hypothetical protein PTO1410 [Picrophilus oshimae DSM 9789]SMD30934.1 hypothetical protein SAMN02745355_0852 [Picrophilus oshimae DSM 9789]